MLLRDNVTVSKNGLGWVRFLLRFGFALAYDAPRRARLGRRLSLLVAAAIAVDFGVQANLVFGYRAIFALAPETRGRLNGVYLSTAFVGCAIGSALGAWAYARGGWGLACCVGLTPPLIALARFSSAS